jgi:hypothetical protein
VPRVSEGERGPQPGLERHRPHETGIHPLRPQPAHREGSDAELRRELSRRDARGDLHERAPGRDHLAAASPEVGQRERCGRGVRQEAELHLALRQHGAEEIVELATIEARQKLADERVRLLSEQAEAEEVRQARPIVRPIDSVPCRSSWRRT